jgi:hypothetical protein
MKKSTVAIIMLFVLLLASNIWWLYKTIDFGVTYTHMLDTYEITDKALNQAITLLPVVAQDNISRENIIKAASLPNDTIGPFEKEGYVWVGEIGLKFNEQGKLIKARRSWEQ